MPPKRARARRLACLARRRFVSCNASCPSALKLELTKTPLPRAPADLELTNDSLALDVQGSVWPAVAPPAAVAGRLLQSESPTTPSMPLPAALVLLAGRTGPSPASILAAMACSCPLRRGRASVTISARRRARSRHRTHHTLAALVA